ncbi:MAG: hypothetical protein Q8L15_18455 [Methylobacter sp.]|nr:hypothetical protein [Methylobacter sp.]
MATELARQKAAQAWCKETTSGKEMDTDLADAFAEILDEIWSKPWLGNATTGEMLEELKARAEVGGYAAYRTVDGDA